MNNIKDFEIKPGDKIATITHYDLDTDRKLQSFVIVRNINSGFTIPDTLIKRYFSKECDVPMYRNLKENNVLATNIDFLYATHLYEEYEGPAIVNTEERLVADYNYLKGDFDDYDYDVLVTESGIENLLILGYDNKTGDYNVIAKSTAESATDKLNELTEILERFNKDYIDDPDEELKNILSNLSEHDIDVLKQYGLKFDTVAE